MKSTIALIVLLSAVVSFAKPQDITLFQCATTNVVEGQHPTQFFFYVKNLNVGKRLEYYFPDENDMEYPVKMVPENSVLMLNENHSLSLIEKGLLLESDGDGCQLTDVLLYKNTNYTRGYASVKPIGGCGAEPVYSTVACKVTTIK